MYLKDINSNLIKKIITSFELSYQSICEKNIPEAVLLEIPKKEDNGWVRFYFQDYQNSYLPDTDDTVLYYIALLKVNHDKHKFNALKIIQDCDKAKTIQGLVATWPQRNLNTKEQNDPVVNLHFIWLCHLLKIQDKTIEDYLLNWISSEHITTPYYHNEKFILFSCLKASEDFNESKFKTKFLERLKERIENRKVKMPLTFKELDFYQGVFRHIGKDVFFHFFNNQNASAENKTLDVNLKDIDNYYEIKENMYNPYKNGQADFDKIKEYDFKNSVFYKMGCLRIFEGDVVKDDIALFDATIYDNESIEKFNPFVKNNSFSIRPHLNRTLGMLPQDIQSVLRKYWGYSHQYVRNAKYELVNSFMMIQPDDVQIPEHKHQDIGSILTFVLVLGDDMVNTDFVIEDEVLKFPQSQFFMINFAGYPKSHEVIKRDRNSYIYFVFDLNQKAPNKNEISVLPLLK